MYIFSTVASLKKYLSSFHKAGQPIGFVPTMGALHEGHLSLIRQAATENTCCVCSIFVNPTQFNETSDLEQYPRTPAKDIERLLTTDCDVLFLPSVAEIYPPNLDNALTIDLAGLDKTMEGAFRPGHFHGVVQVVKRLLDIVSPQRLYLGQKDFQQAAIVHYMIRILDLEVALLVVPTKREEDGLAQSSRNQRLTPTARRQAPAIYQTLVNAREKRHRYPLAKIKAEALTELSAAGLRPEYFTIIDGETLREIDSINGVQQVVACTAAWAGEVRLIDNLILQDK